ncbi:hypothetical protein E2C01_009678 [Portunus trituberculatus]|uniref:Uncharacterized protein n=1 Tax=Portunus trituberculatus TaxID=210409 RepID=A0A5B7D6D9_PORTR|nr:hypothetical protein [Portunus trituberculatus]
MQLEINHISAPLTQWCAEQYVWLLLPSSSPLAQVEGRVVTHRALRLEGAKHVAHCLPSCGGLSAVIGGDDEVRNALLHVVVGRLWWSLSHVHHCSVCWLSVWLPPADDGIGDRASVTVHVTAALARHHHCCGGRVGLDIHLQVVHVTVLLNVGQNEGLAHESRPTYEHTLDPASSSVSSASSSSTGTPSSSSEDTLSSLSSTSGASSTSTPFTTSLPDFTASFPTFRGRTVLGGRPLLVPPLDFMPFPVE